MNDGYLTGRAVVLKVLIADDHSIVRRGVRSAVQSQPQWEVCAETANGAAVVNLALEHKPNVVVLDVSLPGLNGIAVTRQVRQLLPSTEVLLFTMHEDDETVSGGLAAGARGFLLKSDGDVELIAAISSLGAHKPYFSTLVSELLLDAAVNERKKSRLESFTIREIEVAQLITEGHSNKRIARNLGISAKTVESHRASAMRKAGVHSATALVRFTIKHNLVQP